MCLIAYQAHEQEKVLLAEFVYDGKSLCASHVNTVRGLSETFYRYPKPDAEAWWRHCRDAHDNVIYIGDAENIHQKDYPNCGWRPENSNTN
jgi:hypothetical protein